MYTNNSASCATTRALAIPEVATLIISSSNLSRADFANLRQVCRYTSERATPFLWKNATAEGLLALIKSAMLYRYNGKVDSIFLDAEEVEYQNFDKFHFYAQYVENLEIYDQESYRCYSMDGWHILGLELKTRGRPLIPNLNALRFLNTSSSHGIDESKWIQVFAHPGLKEVSLIPDPPMPAGRIPFLAASIILKNLLQYCPDIQILHLAPNDNEHYPATLDRKLFDISLFRAALEYQPSQRWYQAVHALTRLQHLTVSEGWLYPASLRVLGSLPELESLSIVRGPPDDFDYFGMDPNLPDGAFPKLIELSILGLEAWGIGIILEAKGMLRRLTTIKLEFYFDVLDGTSNERYYSEMHKLFQGLHDTPYLRELHVHFPFQPEEGERPAEVYDLMECMGPHPLLEYVHLDGIRIDKDYRRNFDSIRKLAAIWPNVRTLLMPSQHASIRDLEDFVRLPSLKYLTVKLNLKYPDPHLGLSAKPRPGFALSPLQSLTSSGPLRLGISHENITLCAGKVALSHGAQVPMVHASDTGELAAFGHIIRSLEETDLDSDSDSELESC
ncbi:unnamed protein product [Rhizoctonia solani]|uniref:Uncharacterized protein n=1 Tax=Rhizoctonia solani TaxID=456999 RepID=A0A8H3BHT1_9AGAM|nr:unnamed protein product [Rhizoctonia solani]